MKKRILSILLAALLGSIPAAAADDGVVAPEIKNEGEITDVEETVKAQAIVHEDEIVRDASPNLLGLCTEWVNGQAIMKRGTTEFADGFSEIAKEMRHIYNGRTAGMSLNFFKWRTSIGPYSSRKVPEPTFWGASSPLEYGPVEWVQSIQMMNPDAEFIVGMNVTGDTAQSNIDYAEFMLGDPETSEFGRLRAELGLREPVKVAAFELGNEVDGPVTPEQYVKLCKPVIAGVREKFPDAKFCACGKTYPLELPLDSMEWRAWNRTIYKEIGAEINYISHHAYYDGQRTAHIERYLDKMKEDEMDLLGTDRIDFMFTEQAKWPGNYGQEGALTDTNQLSGVLSTAEFFNRMYQRRDAAYADCFQFPTGDGTPLTSDWCILGQSGGKFYMTGILHMFNMYGDALGDQVVKNEVISESVYAQKEQNDSQFTLNVMTDGDQGLSLILVNKSGTRAFDLDFSFGHTYQLVSEAVFTAPELTSQVADARTADIFTTTVTEKKEADFSHYVMQPKAIVNLKLVRTDGGPDQGGGPAFEGGNLFQDLDGFWGKNEVNLLAEAGLLEGDGNGCFYPGAPLSRAELAAMLDRALLEDESETRQVFSDVPPDAWYGANVCHVYAAGLVRGVGGGRFDPEGGLTNEELATIAARAAAQYRTAGVSEKDTALADWNYRDEISDWAMPHIIYGVNSGLLKNFYENGNFRPGDAATRGSAAVLLYRLWSMK